MIDFKQIKTGEDFELLCEDLLREMGYTIEASVSRGPDMGRDIIASKTVLDEMGFTEDYRYLVECKHYAKSGKSVQEADIGSPVARMSTHNCNRYILITSTIPSEKVRVQLKAVSNAVPDYKATAWARNHLTRFLEQHPDVWERHVSLELVTGTPAHLLASEVETWFEAMGYTISDSRSIGDGQVEMVSEMDKGTIRQRLLVRCLDGEADPKRVGALLKAVQERGFAEGWSITDRRVSPTVRKLARENAALRAFNLSEFMQLTFGPYFDALTRLVDGSRIPEYYVDLGCYKLVTDTEGREVGRERYEVIDDYIDDWLRERGKKHISILGEFGAGKTWFCRHYAHRQLQRYLSDPVRERLPLLITLRDFTKAMTARQLIQDALLEKYKLPLVGSSFDVFERLNRKGKLLLVFDGFDEMARRVDYQTVVDNFWELASVLVEASKVLLTSRTEYFRYAQESEKILRGEESGRATIVLDPPKFEVLYLEPLSDEQVTDVIAKRVEREEGDIVARRILSTPNLAALARKPVLIELLLAALDEVGPASLTNPAQVYLYATNALLMRNITTKRTFTTTADKLFFLCEMAWEMIRANLLRMSYKRIPERIQAWFGPRVANEEIDHWDFDLRNQTLLQRNAIGEYEFAHRSMAEYFVAYKFAAELGCLRAEFQRTYCEADGNPCQAPIGDRSVKELSETFGSSSLSEEHLMAVSQLLKWMVGDPARLWALVDKTKGRTAEEVRYVGGNAATLLNHLGESFEKAQLSHANLTGADLTNANMSNADLRGAVLHKVDLTGVTLMGADLYDADLRGLTIDELGEIRTLATFPDRHIFACGGTQGTENRGFVRVCDWEHGIWVTSFPLQATRVLSVAYSISGRYLACGTEDGVVAVWDTDSGELVLDRRVDAYVAKLAWALDQDWLVVSKGPTSSTGVEIWEFPSGRMVGRYAGHGISVSAAVVLPGGKTAMSCDFQGNIKLWEIVSQRTVYEVQAAAGKWSRDMVVSVNGDRVVFGRPQGDLVVMDLPDFKCPVGLKDSWDTFTCLQCSPDDQCVAGCNESGEVKVWDLNSGTLLQKLSCRERATSICFASDGQHLVMALRTGCVTVWDTSSLPWKVERVLEQRLNCQGARIGGPLSAGLSELRDNIPLKDWFVRRGAMYLS
jgi:hypothetical protein